MCLFFQGDLGWQGCIFCGRSIRLVETHIGLNTYIYLEKKIKFSGFYLLFIILLFFVNICLFLQVHISYKIWWLVLLHNGGFCNGCITKRHNSTNAPHKDLFSWLFYSIKNPIFCHFLDYIYRFSYERKFSKYTISVLWYRLLQNPPLYSITTK
jgi:hypothetical protein